MIELTSGYIYASSPKVLINPKHIVYVQATTYENASYSGVNAYVEYLGGKETQALYTKETYEQIKEMLK